MMRRVLPIGGVGCGLLCILGLCVITMGVPYVRASGAREAATGFLADLRSANWSSAFQRTGSGYQSGRDATRLQTGVQAISELATHTDVGFSAQDVEGDEVTLEGMLSGPEGSTPIAMELSRVNDYWYVDLVVVRGRPLR